MIVQIAYRSAGAMTLCMLMPVWTPFVATFVSALKVMAGPVSGTLCNTVG